MHCCIHERGELSGAAPIGLDTSASVGLRHARGRPRTRAETCIRVATQLHSWLGNRRGLRGKGATAVAPIAFRAIEAATGPEIRAYRVWTAHGAETRSQKQRVPDRSG